MQLKRLEPRQLSFGPQPLGAGNVVLTQHAADLVLATHHLAHHPLAQHDQRAPRAHVDRGDVHRRDHVQQEQLGQLLRIDLVVLALALVDQPQLPRMRDGHVMRDGPQLLVQVSVAAGGLVADRKGLIELPQPVDHRGARPFELNLVDRPAGGVENAQRRLLGMNVQSDVEHASLLFGFEATCHEHVDLALA